MTDEVAGSMARRAPAPEAAEIPLAAPGDNGLVPTGFDAADGVTDYFSIIKSWGLSELGYPISDIWT